jgi:hypothetical protein
MPHVTTHYRVIVVEGHHRQPRNANKWLEPNPQSDAEVVPGTTITPYAPPQLAYTDNGEPQVATFLFWSATDGTNGQTTSNQTLNQLVSSAPMTLTAWYLPPGGLGINGPGYLLDAFSDAAGDFVDDTFVTVTSDPSLTNEANVVGIIPTTNAETLVANNSISTGETFEHWIGDGNASGTTDALAAGTSGVAIATYHRQNITLPNPGQAPREGWVLLGGIAVDGGGWEYPIGHPGGGGPVGPWGPYLQRVARAAFMTQLATSASLAEVQKLALNDIATATKQLQGQIERTVER